jgi:hypothetical protein
MITFKQFLTEASGGAAKWEKYFADADTETIVKTDGAQLFDTFGNKVDKTVARGDKITVLAGEYDSKPRVRIGKGEYRMKLADIDKPFKMEHTVKSDLKPDVLGLVGEFKISTMAKKIKSLIDDHSEIPEHTAEFLKALVDHAEKPDDTKKADKVKDLFVANEIKTDTALKNSIQRDFMELLGPFFVVNEKAEFKSGKANFPELGNAPLFDFEIIVDGETTQFSSKKSGGNSNTLKVNEVVKAAQGDAALRKKYKREIELMTIIQDNPVKTTPNLINDWLAKTFPAKYKPAEMATDNTTIARLEAAVVKWINDQSGLDFLPLVKLAIPDLWYVKSKLNSDGTIKVEPLKSGRDVPVAKLRSKSSPGHLSDKIGFAM